MASKVNRAGTRINRIEILTILQATEDPGKVRKAIHNLLPSGDSRWVIQETRAHGHHGNSLAVLGLSIHRKPRDILEHIKQALPESDVCLLREQVPQRMDGVGFFHFRVDKQQAYLGRTRLASSGSDTISIKVKLQSYPSRRENLIQGMLGLLD